MDTRQQTCKRTDPVTYALRERRSLGQNFRWLKVANSVQEHHKGVELGQFYLKGYAKNRPLGKTLEMVVLRQDATPAPWDFGKETRTDFLVYLPKVDEFAIFPTYHRGATQDIQWQLGTKMENLATVTLIPTNNRFTTWHKPVLEEN